MARSTGEMAIPARTVQHPEAVAKHVASSSWLELLERVGYVVRGVLYAVMGSLAFGLAVGVGGMATDQSGSLVILGGGPLGKGMLLAFAVGLGGYSVWGFVRAVFDPLHRGDDPPGIAERLGFAWSGIAYAGLAVFALELFAGAGQAASHDSTRSTIARFFAYPAGHWVVVAIGLVSISVGLWQFLEAKTARFKKDLKREQMTDAEEKFVVGLGRFGMLSRGVTFTLVGWFILQAGLHRDPNRVQGFSGAFTYLLSQPYGHLLLGIVAAGFVALGLHSFAAARWMRLLGSRN